MMEVVLGPIPKAMAQAAKGAQNCFAGRDSRLNWPADASKRSIRYDHARQCKSKSSLFLPICFSLMAAKLVGVA